MKLTCLQENLNYGLSIVNHIGNTKTTLPILNNVLIEAKNGALSLVSTNLEIGIKTIIRAKIEKDGRFTVPMQIFSSYINFLPNKPIELELIKDILIIKCANYQTKIKGSDAADFPLIPQIEKKEKYSFKIKEFKKTIQQTIIAVNPSEIRTEISGLFFNFNSPKDKEITIAGTDSYRLAEKSLKFDNHGNSENKKVIIPLKTLKEVINILEEKDNEIDIYLSENQILFSFGETELNSRLIAGDYPNYKQIIPQEFKTETICKTEELIKAVKGAGLFSRSGINDVSFYFNPVEEKIIISSLNNQIGENVSEIEGEIKGEENKIVFNYRFLLDGLVHLNNEIKWSISINEQNRIGLIKSTDDEDYLYVLMPIGQD